MRQRHAVHPPQRVSRGCAAVRIGVLLRGGVQATRLRTNCGGVPVNWNRTRTRPRDLVDLDLWEGGGVSNTIKLQL
ncbi:hypothetical protein GALMADRAFT_1210927 [Galerina marginata CBS 339.88]|uniref:Uncharacterized protein n=1 Tax=Galerina marginata (strain CBS 339.88) TaxID=685588 RepID=A0A067S5H5_GALM3|nr:hypothetical protein GALMADRAFT_1210927 [Galerina marginata CBS 339.88]